MVINYVIGRPWDPKEPDHLSLYMIHNSIVFRGTIEQAQSTLDYVNAESEEKFDIYEVSMRKITS